ncbi:MAG: DUF2764 family protein [Phycisphaerae bacterium]|nr:DUF2764 family protein [Phycisphaerae bacterium]
MPEQYYYLLSGLPEIGELGDAPPITPADLLAFLDGSEKPLRVVEAIFLSDDLLQRDAFLSGEVETPETVVLTGEQVKDESPLPQELQLQTDSPRKIASDATWEAYFRYAAAVGKESCSLLSQWVGFEVTLRNEIALTRAQSLGLDGEEYVVARSLQDEDEHQTYSALVGEWSAAMGKSPLAAQRVLDTARWKWLQQNDAYFSFKIDELVVYAARLMLTWRWYRLGQAAEKLKRVEVN